MTDGATKHDLHPAEAETRQRGVLIRFLRMGYFVLLLTVTLLAIVRVTDTPKNELSLAVRWWVPLLAAVLLFTVVLGVDLLTPRKKVSTISGVLLGLMAGMVATMATGFVIDALAALWDFDESQGIIAPTKVLVGISLCYLAVTTVLQTQDDFRLVIPYVEFSKERRGPRPLLVDTSVLIDARIVDLADTGIVQAPVVIPGFVMAELQRLADSQDKLKRAKGRRGLDVIARLQRLGTVDVTIDETEVAGAGVDQQLVELARGMSAMVVSADIALNRIASIQGVRVLNINEVASALKPSLIPGDTVSLTVLRPGEQRGQGVGYLDDGTMVVVEDGFDRLGQRVMATVTSSLQTAAGRLIFSRVGDAAPDRGAAAPALASSAPGGQQTELAPALDRGAALQPAAPAGASASPMTTNPGAAPGDAPAPPPAEAGPTPPPRAFGPPDRARPPRPPTARNPRR